MTTKMNPAVKEKWVAALRSGEYQQTQHVLRDDNGYCCLGVLCDVALKEGLPIQPRYDVMAGRWKYGGDDLSLPVEVSEWAGLTQSDPEVVDGYRASAYNDMDGLAFTEIADLIEEHL